MAYGLEVELGGLCSLLGVQMSYLKQTQEQHCLLWWTVSEAGMKLWNASD